MSHNLRDGWEYNGTVGDCEIYGRFAGEIRLEVTQFAANHFRWSISYEGKRLDSGRTTTIEGAMVTAEAKVGLA